VAFWKVGINDLYAANTYSGMGHYLSLIGVARKGANLGARPKAGQKSNHTLPEYL
jgi:hypothetical protein